MVGELVSRIGGKLDPSNATGTIMARLAQLSNDRGQWTPFGLSSPYWGSAADATIAANATIANQLQRYRDLTINNGIVLTTGFSPQIIICRNLIFGNGSSQIKSDGLGAGSALNADGTAYNSQIAGVGVWNRPGGHNPGSTVFAVGPLAGIWAGGAITNATPTAGQSATPLGFFPLLFYPLMAGLGGGGGSAGTGGGGFGVGGGGSSATTGVTAGGAGGGVLIVICDDIQGAAGLITANGLAGTNSTNGAGGGGGGLALVYTRAQTTTPTVQATGGAGGTGTTAGGAGGAGLARIVRGNT